MTQKEIRAARKAIEKERRVAKAQLRACEARLKALQANCGHPQIKRDEYDMHCPDCGYHEQLCWPGCDRI